MLTSSLLGDRRGQVVEVADVFVVDVDIDEPAQLLAVEEPLAEGGILRFRAGPGSRRRWSRPPRRGQAPAWGRSGVGIRTAAMVSFSIETGLGP